jgi:hypothetical protein
VPTQGPTNPFEPQPPDGGDTNPPEPTPPPAPATSPAPTTIAGAIAESAIGGVRKAMADGVQVEGHSLPDQIAADKYAKAVAVTNPFKCIRTQRFSMPGGVA